MGCLILLALLGGLFALIWIWSAVSTSVNPEPVKERAAIRSCTERLGDEYMPGFKGLNLEGQVAVAKAGNLYTVDFGIGEATWCKVEVIMIDGKPDVLFINSSWRAK